MGRAAGGHAPDTDHLVDALDRCSAKAALRHLVTHAATREPGEPHHLGHATGASVWGCFSAAADGTAVVATTDNTFDTVVAVYEGQVMESLFPVAADDDGGGNLASQVAFQVSEGRRYCAAIDGYAGARGAATVSWSLPAGSGDGGGTDPVGPRRVERVAGRTRYETAVAVSQATTIPPTPLFERPGAGVTVAQCPGAAARGGAAYGGPILLDGARRTAGGDGRGDRAAGVRPS